MKILHLFFVEPPQIGNKTVTITGEDVKHISRVLRFNKGEKVKVSDSRGIEYICEIIQLNIEDVLLKIISKQASNTEPPIEVILYQGLPKAQKMDLIVQKTTELGISKIVPVTMNRTVVKLDNKTSNKKVDRWQKIAYEASKQSMRGKIPTIDNITSFKEFLSLLKGNDLNILAYEGERFSILKDLTNQLKANNINKVGIIVGPEGGFETEEVEDILAINCTYSTRLGPRILRTETAGFTLLSIIMYEIEQ